MTGIDRSKRIGPGRLVPVVGPSGAGKDTLIRAAREWLSRRPDYCFPRRAITRPSSDAEDNLVCDPQSFAETAGTGGFAVSWTAHGLSYGIPAMIDLAVTRGHTVVCNVSRTVIGALRLRYENVYVVEITAPAHVLAERLVLRGRAQDGPLLRRIERSREIEDVRPDLTIVNSGPVDQACAAFLRALLADADAGVRARRANAPPA